MGACVSVLCSVPRRRRQLLSRGIIYIYSQLFGFSAGFTFFHARFNWNFVGSLRFFGAAVDLCAAIVAVWLYLL